MTAKHQVTLIYGPTASGKSGLALDQAQKKPSVIINADSLQIYRDLPILTARPGVEDMAGIPHRLYGFADADQVYSVARWLEDVLHEIAHAFDAGQHPFVVGGTGLYLKALRDGLSAVPDIPTKIREEIRHQHKRLGPSAFWEKLQACDPVMAERLHANDTQRVMRAMEVICATGRSLADWQKEGNQKTEFHLSLNFDYVPVIPDRVDLYARCDARFESMMTHGALSEVAAFEGSTNAAVTRALGFHALNAHVKGEISLEEAVAKAKTETRQYAKRQMTWFRHQF